MAAKTVKEYTLKEAAAYLNVGVFNMRRLMREEIVKGEKRQTGNLTKGHPGKWFIPKTELDKYAKNRKRINDGKRVFQMRLSPTQLVIATKILKEIDIEISPRYTRKS